jgi:hypothetical protein
VVRVAIDVPSELQVLSTFAWYCTTPWVATWQWFELQLIYTPSCKYWVLPPNIVLPLQLQPDSGSSCNWYTVRVTNTKCFRLILYYPFSCNRTVVRVAIDAHSELQILSASVWYYTTPSVVARYWFELQLIYTPSCKYWMLLPDTVLPVPLQPDSGLSCNWYTLQLANTKCFRLILYYPFSCNWIVVRVAIDVHYELQILSASAWYCNRTVARVAIDIHSELQILSASAWYYTTPSVATP